MPWPIDPRLWEDVSHVRELKFAISEYAIRLERLREAMAKHDIDVFVCHLHPSLLYLTGLQTSSFWTWFMLVVPREGPLVLLSDEADVHNALASSWLPVESVWAYSFAGADPLAESVELLRHLGCGSKRIALEGNAQGIGAELGLPARMQQGLKDGLPDARWLDLEGLVETLMAVKSPAEIDAFRRASAFSRIGMQAMIDAAVVGCTDTQLAAAIHEAVYAAGGEPFVIDPLMSVGAKSGIFHTKWNRTVMRPGDAVFCEVGGCYKRYSAPMMRTLVLEPGPDDLHRRMLDACREAVQLTIDGLHPGVSGRELGERASRPLHALPDEIIKDGNRAYSLEAGELIWSAWPGYVSECLNETIIEAGHVMHVRAATRRVGRYGATFSETVLVTDQGSEVLTGGIPLEVVVK